MIQITKITTNRVSEAAALAQTLPNESWSKAPITIKKTKLIERGYSL